jgi:glucose-1-phosphate thymidylyltransferase
MLKGVITAAGLGTRSGLDGRLRKELLPLYDRIEGKLVLRPILDIIIRRLEYSGCKEVCVILDPSDKITKIYLTENFPDCSFVYQSNKAGFGNAVSMAYDFIENDDFIINAGDGLVATELYYGEISKTKSSLLTLFETEHPEDFGNAKVDLNNMMVTDVVEKPKIPLSHYALSALYFFKNEFRSFLSEDSVELTPLISQYIQSGEKVSFKVIPKSEWLSIGRKEKYHEVLKDSFNIYKN